MRTAPITAPGLTFVVNNAAFFESHRLLVALRARSEGFDVRLCTGHEASATLAGSAMPRLRSAGIRHQRVAFQSAGMNPLRETAGLLQLVWHLVRHRPRLVHCASPKGVLYGGIAARLACTPGVVLAVSGMGFSFTAGQDSWLRRCAGRVWSAMATFAFGHPNKRVIVQNTDDRDNLLKLGLAQAHELHLIPGSGVDLKRFVHLPIAGRECLVVLPARLLRDKGVAEFAQAAAIVRALYPQWRFALVGTADYDNPSAVSQAELAQWQAQGVLEWWGHCEDMASVLARAAIVCLPSYREGMPRALLEAAAAGCAVVTTDVTGCRDAVQAGVTGLLVPARDHKALARALCTLITQPDLLRRQAQAGRERAQKMFDIDDVLASTMALYQELNHARKT